MVRKEIFVENLKDDNQTLIDYFQVVEAAVRKTKRSTDFMTLKLRDNTGCIEARLWDIPEGFTVFPGNFVKIEFTTELYNKALQIKISRIKVLPIEEVYIADYLPCTPYDIEEMWQRLTGLVHCIADDSIRNAVEWCLQTNGEKFRQAPAAKGNHQPYIGGLLEHTLAIASLVEAVCEVYDQLNREPLDQDILVAAAVVHDIGKIFELQYDNQIGYTMEGTLIGHIVQGYELWIKYDGGIQEPKRTHIRHILISHHGRRDWGSPVIPASREAVLFHHLDMIDSRMGFIDTLGKAATDDNGFTQFDRHLEGPLWRPNGKKESQEQERQILQGVEEPRAEEVKGGDTGTAKETDQYSFYPIATNSTTSGDGNKN